MTPGMLLLADGRSFRGRAFGSQRSTLGEVVFNTSMTGYQEILTDPSYAGQIITLTCPEIGNVGINALDAEAPRSVARGLIVRSLSPVASSHRSEGTLEDWMVAHDLPGLMGVDTRALTRHLRSSGCLRGILAIGAAIEDESALLQQVRTSPELEGPELVDLVSCRTPYRWDQPTPEAWGSDVLRVPDVGQMRPRVVALDCGIKRSILRLLVDVGFDVRVVPARTSAQALLALEPQGVFVSNGPGDPAALTDIVHTLQALLGRIPIFGICLGHQLLALALGARTFKLPFGHRGGNHPVKDLRTGRVSMTVHNHGFAVDPSSLPAEVRVTHINLNDGTCEGLELPGRAAFSIQYHPEAGPGPHDAQEHFSRFRALVREWTG